MEVYNYIISGSERWTTFAITRAKSLHCYLHRILSIKWCDKLNNA